MKKFALIALFAVAVIGFASAATPTGTIALTGTVAESFSLTVPAGKAVTMDDTKDTVTSIGNVIVVSNAKNWTISVSSANAGYLVSTTDNSEKAQYKITLDSLATDQALDHTWISASQARTAKTGVSLALSVKVLASSTFFQTGNYSDTLTVTIAHP